MNRVLDAALRGFGRSVGWKLGALALAALLAMFAGNARAQTQHPGFVSGSPNKNTYTDQGYANHACQKDMARAKTAANFSSMVKPCTHEPTNKQYLCLWVATNNIQSGCGTNISNEQHQVIYYAYTGACAARANLTSGYINANTTNACKHGCVYREAGGTRVTVDLGAAGGWIKAVNGWEPDGTVCTTENVPNNDDQCLPIAGQSVCKNTEGKLCYSASTGRRICWDTNEIGQKTDGDKAQVRNQGNEAIPPNIGQPTTPTAPPITTTITNTTNNTTNTTTITTGTHSTTSGGPAGNSNSGENTNPNGTGTGTGTGGSTGGTNTTCGGSGQPACPPDNTSSGGTDCQAPPTSGGDPLLVQIAYQGWRAACSGDDLDDKLRDDAGALQGATPGLGEGDSIFAQGEGNDPNISTGLLGGGGSCPVTGSYEITDGVSFTVPSQFCDTIAALRWLFMTIAYAWALRILV